MKKNLFISICTALGLLAGISSCSKDSEVESMLQGGQQDVTTKVIIRDSLTVEVDTVGTVAEKIGAKASTVQKLIIKGPINAVDVDTIRKLPQLIALNLKEAIIQGGDETYSVTISSSTTNRYRLYDNEIGVNMFRRTNLGEIILPDKLVAIGSYAFSGLRGTTDFPFQTIDIPEGVTRLGEDAFYDCTSLESVKLPSSLKSIEFRTFWRCYDLSNVDLGGVEHIGEEAFNECSSLQNIELSTNIKSLGHRCFRQTGLTSITIPESVTSFGNEENSDYGQTFMYCDDLRTVVLPDNMTEIPYGMFEGCSRLTSVNIPQQVTHIRAEAFDGCSSLSEITFNEVLVDIGNEAFRGCENLDNIVLPETLAGIGGSSFRECTSLTSISIPDNTGYIGASCFQDCTSLSSVILSNQMTTLPQAAFRSCTSLESITLPESITSIQAYCFQYCGKLSQVVFPEGLEIIYNAAFVNCSSLESIELPSTLRHIGFNAFQETGLINIELPDGVEILEHDIFNNCRNLRSATIPPSVESVGAYMFSNCLKLTSIFWNTSATVPTLFSGTSNSQNRNCLLYISDPNTLVEDGYIKNIIVNGVADEIVLSSVHGDFFVPQEFKTTRITYTRDFTFPTYPGEASGWRSICLPFTVENIIGPEEQALAPFGANEEDAPSIGDDDEGVPFSTRTADAKPFWLRRLTPNGFENVTRIEANVPYIIAMPNNEAYDDEYNIRGTVTFRTENAAGITIPATGEMTQDVGPTFTLNCNFSYHPASATIYVLNERVIDDHPAGSVFVRNERDVMPFEGYVSSNALARMFAIDAGRAATRSTKPLGPVPSIDDM